MLNISTVVKCNFRENLDIEIKIFTPNNDNTSLMETIYQNKYLFNSLQEIDSIKKIIDVICQNTIEKEADKEASGYGLQLDNGEYQILTNREYYLLRQNNNGQNVLHLVINAFKNFSNRLLIMYTLIEYIKQYLTYESWSYLCFVQVNRPFEMFSKHVINGVEYKMLPAECKLNIGLTIQEGDCPTIQNGGMSVIQNLYYMRYPLIIGFFNDQHQNYSIRQNCVEALKTYQKWQYPHGMTEEQKLDESRVLRQLVVAQYVLQQLCMKLYHPRYRYAISLWSDSPQTLSDIVLGETQDIEFHFSGELSLLNDILKDILFQIFDTTQNNKFNLKQLCVDYSFDVKKIMTRRITGIVNKHVQEVFDIIRNHISNGKKQTAVVSTKVYQQNQRKQNVDEGSSSVDGALEKLCSNEKKVQQFTQIYITQIGGTDDRNKINKFDTSIESINSMFEQHCQQIILREQGDETQMVNIPEFLMYLVNPSTKMSWSNMQTILTNSNVVFALRVWLQEVVDTVKWRLFLPERYRSTQYRRYIDVNVFGFLIYIGIPLILLTNVLSAQLSTGDDFSEMLCCRCFKSHFELLNRSRFHLYDGPGAPSIGFVMVLMQRQWRNIEIDKLNVEFLAYFTNNEINEFKPQVGKNRSVKSLEHEYLRAYIIETLKHDHVLDQHFENGCPLTVKDVPEKMLNQITDKCKQFVESYNANSPMIKTSMPEKSFIQKAILDEYTLQTLEERIDVSNVQDGYVSISVCVTLRQTTIKEVNKTKYNTRK